MALNPSSSSSSSFGHDTVENEDQQTISQIENQEQWPMERLLGHDTQIKNEGKRKRTSTTDELDGFSKIPSSFSPSSSFLVFDTAENEEQWTVEKLLDLDEQIKNEEQWTMESLLDLGTHMKNEEQGMRTSIPDELDGFSGIPSFTFPSSSFLGLDTAENEEQWAIPSLLKNEEQYRTTRTTTTDKLKGSSGFRFRPTDAELVQDYLIKKVLGLPPSFIIKELDLYCYNPDKIPRDFMNCLDDEPSYFFVFNTRKHLEGKSKRVKRCTPDGAWKETTKGDIISSNGVTIIAFKKSFVFRYTGKESEGAKTEWMMKEYSLNQELEEFKKPNDPKMDDCVLCKIYKKKRRPNQRKEERKEEEDSNKSEEAQSKEVVENFEEEIMKYLEIPENVSWLINEFDDKELDDKEKVHTHIP